MKRLIAFIFLVIVSIRPSLAEESAYEYCSISGYLYGEGSIFMAELAQKITIDKGLITDMVCSSTFKDAREIGARFSSSGKYGNENERMLGNKVAKFKERIQKAILKSAGY